MTTRIGNAGNVIGASDIDKTPRISPSNEEIETLPAPHDARLQAMMDGGDVGGSIAAMIMLSNKDRREVSRASRDSAYAAEESAQNEEIQHMKGSALTSFTAGLVQGGFQFMSAGASAASVSPGANATTSQSELQSSSLSDADRATTAGDLASAQSKAGYLQASSKGFDGSAGLAGTVGKFMSDADDREAKMAANQAAGLKRSAEASADDVKDADDAMKRAVELLKEWTSSKDASMAAALHRA